MPALLSWFVLSRMRKNEHQYRTPNARNGVALCEAVEEVAKTSAKPHPPANPRGTAAP